MPLEAKMKQSNGPRDVLWLVGLLLSSVLYSAVLGASPLYRWVDDKGRVHFSDKPVGDAQTHEVKTPTVVGGVDDQQQMERNKAWFEQDRERRAEEQAAAKKAKAKEQKAKQKQMASCQKARDKLNQGRAELKARKRAGVTPKSENKLKLWLEGLERKASAAC